MIRSHQLFPEGQRRGEGSAAETRLSKAWQAIVNGQGSTEDAELILGDLAEATGYFYIAPAGVTGDALQRREGAREVMARILFLLDLPASYMSELRRVALDELQTSNSEGER